MGTINVGRVVAGGLVAGLIVNISETVLNLFVVASGMETALREHNLPQVGGSAIGVFVVLCFLLSIASVWLYAAIRPRFGPGPQTAVLAAVIVWFFAYMYPGVGMAVMQLYPAKLVITSELWGLGEIVLGTLAGAAIYTE